MKYLRAETTSYTVRTIDSTDQDLEKKTKETKMMYAEVVGKNSKNVLNCKQVDVVPRRIHWDPTVKYKETSSSKDR